MENSSIFQNKFLEKIMLKQNMNENSGSNFKITDIDNEEYELAERVYWKFKKKNILKINVNKVWF